MATDTRRPSGKQKVRFSRGPCSWNRVDLATWRVRARRPLIVGISFDDTIQKYYGDFYYEEQMYISDDNDCGMLNLQHSIPFETWGLFGGSRNKSIKLLCLTGIAALHRKDPSGWTPNNIAARSRIRRQVWCILDSKTQTKTTVICWFEKICQITWDQASYTTEQ